jgi:hypothetical protein
MSFFQNPFPSEFRGSLVLSDRQYNLTFIAPGHAGRGDENVFSNASGPFNFTVNDGEGNPTSILNIHFAYSDNDYQHWSKISVNVATVGNASATTLNEVVTALNQENTFKSLFLASVTADGGRVLIKSKKPVTRMKFYISNGQADTLLRFNALAGVAELPTYFSRHTIANRFNFSDSTGQLVQLNPISLVDENVINTAKDKNGKFLGLSHADVKPDWKLLSGRSGLFQITIIGTGLSSSATNRLIYPAGAKAGDLSLRIITELDGGGQELRRFEIPYTLTQQDLFEPPTI